MLPADKTYVGYWGLESGLAYQAEDMSGTRIIRAFASYRHTRSGEINETRGSPPNSLRNICRLLEAGSGSANQAKDMSGTHRVYIHTRSGELDQVREPPKLAANKSVQAT